MIVPSIDLMDGVAVQLVGGKHKALEAGDPRPLAERFGRVGEVAVIDLDAAMGRGSNAALIHELISLARCRVGGGIRDVESARAWLDAGAHKVILGTAAKPEILRALPPERVIAALDAEHGEVVTHGWQTRTGASITQRMAELRDFVGGFLVTFVESEGRMQGINMDQVREVLHAAGEVRVTMAGGVTTPADVAELDRLGADAQVGMALYTGRMDLAEAWCAPLVSDRSDGLWPTVVVDEQGVALGLVYSDLESVKASLAKGRGVYRSRTRGLWEKGAESGNWQELMGIATDCDRDALRFTVRQHGQGFCHLHTRTCWGEGSGLSALMRTIHARKLDAPPGSYTRRLFDDPKLLEAKLLEEAGELAQAQTPPHATWETADLLYFALVAAARQGVTLAEIETELDRRGRQVSRRGGEAKRGSV